MAALASLTATYTDSEGEDDPNDDSESKGAVILTTPSGSPETNSNTSKPNSPQSGRPGKPAKLVSYIDESIISDDEAPIGEMEESQPVVEDNTNSVEMEILEEDGIQLPPDPAGHCSAELQEKILRFHEKMQNNMLDMNGVIQQRKDFRNPSIYEKLIHFCGINELGTNYPPEIYDPLRWGKESYYEELAKVQKAEMEKREKERKAKTEVITGTKKLDDDPKKRKSKWDQPGGNSVSSTNLKPAGLIQPSLTTSATGTKGTVISAFGSLPKKPRP